MVLLRISYRYGASSNFISNCNIARFGVYMLKLCLKMYPPPIKVNHLQKNVTSHPLKKLKDTDKKLSSLGTS